MKKIIQTLTVIVSVISCLLASAGEIRQISWKDLIPGNLTSENLMADLNKEQRDIAIWVINMLEQLPDRGPDTEQYYKQVDEAMPTLKEAGIDIAEIMAKRKKLQTAVVEELDGQSIRIAGYLLPLEASGDKVTEFLLVPFIGACIHVPPPPPNQIVHVKVLQKNGYKNKKLYDPVWVTGKFAIQSMSKELYLADGSSGINIGYSMQTNQIEQYTE